MNKKQKKINETIDMYTKYIFGFSGIVMFIFPIILKFLPIVEWKSRFWLIVSLAVTSVFMTLISIVIVFFREVETQNYKKLQKISFKRIRIIGRIIMLFATIVFVVFISWFLPYSIKGINYLYIQNKEPINKTDLVINANTGTGTSKFTVQDVEFKNLGKFKMWFTASRFKENKKYKITIIPDTKYILDAEMLEN